MFGVFQIIILTSLVVILFFILTFVAITVYHMVRVAYGTRNIVKVPGHPIMENYHMFTNLEDILDGLTSKVQEYGKFFKINLFIGMPAIIVTDMDFIEYLLGTTKILTKSIQYLFLHRWLGEGLLTCRESAMGTKINAQSNSTSEYVTAVRELCRIVLDRTVSPIKVFPTYLLTQDYRTERKCVKIVHGYTDLIIENRRRELEDGNIDYTKGKRLAFLDLLLQAKIDDRLMTDYEIRQEVDTFMFEGHDTTASGISFTLYCLSVNPEVQDNVIEELTNIFGDDKTRAATMQDLQSMSYLERVIKEALRLYPPVPIFGRTSFTDEKYYGGVLPQYSQLMVFPYAIHRDPEIYPDPEKFDPDRFLPENQSKRHPFSYLAFSAGPRNCIGQRFAILEMKSLISHLLRNFEVKPAPNYTPQPVPLAVLKSTNGILLKLEHRL